MSFAGGGTGGPIGEAFILVRADTAKFERDIRAKVAGAAGAAGDDAAKTLANRLDATGDKLTAVGKKLSLSLSLPIVAGMGAATKAASDLNEAVNVTGLVFDDARGEIDAFVKTSAKGLGQSERAAREATAQIGGLLKNLGLSTDETVEWSKKLTVLASDLGSAFNKEPAEAVQALGSALRGETEPIRAFNVMLDDASVKQRAVAMGLAESAGDVDKHAKAQATLAAIMEQTVDVQGDFANTADGVANKSRIMKAELENAAASLGEVLLPIVSKGVGFVSDLATGFSGLPESTQNVAIAAAAALAAVGPISIAAGNAAKALGAMRTASVFLAANPLVLGAAAVVASVGAVVIAAHEFDDAMDELLDNQKASVNAFALGADVTKGAVVDAYVDAANAARAYGDDTELVGDIISRAIKKWGPEAASTLDNLSSKSKVSRERIVQLADALGVNLGDMSDEARDKLDQAIASVSGAVTPTEKLQEATETLGNEFATAKENVEAYDDAVDAALGTFLDAQTSALRFADSVDDLGESIKENGTIVGLNGDKQRDLAGALNDVVRAARDDIDAMAESGIITNDAATKKQALLDRLNDLKKRFPELAGPIDDYIAHLDDIPPTKNTTVNVKFTSSGWNPFPVQHPGDNPFLVEAANGFDGVVSRPTMFLAGEAGTERVTITPTGGSGEAAGGHTINVTFVNPTPEDPSRSISRLDAVLVAAGV